MARIIAEADSHGGGWSAWLEDRAYEAWGGDTAATAVMRLLRARGLSVVLFEADHDPTQSGAAGVPTESWRPVPGLWRTA